MDQYQVKKGMFQYGFIEMKKKCENKKKRTPESISFKKECYGHTVYNLILFYLI